MGDEPMKKYILLFLILLIPLSVNALSTPDIWCDVFNKSVVGGTYYEFCYGANAIYPSTNEPLLINGSINATEDLYVVGINATTINATTFYQNGETIGAYSDDWINETFDNYYLASVVDGINNLTNYYTTTLIDNKLAGLINLSFNDVDNSTFAYVSTLDNYYLASIIDGLNNLTNYYTTTLIDNKFGGVINLSFSDVDNGTFARLTSPQTFTENNTFNKNMSVGNSTFFSYNATCSGFSSEGGGGIFSCN